jgi:hypothetical protein
MLRLEDYESEIVRSKHVSGGRIMLCKLTYPSTTTPWVVWFFDHLGQPRNGRYFLDNQEGLALQDFLDRNS